MSSLDRLDAVIGETDDRNQNATINFLEGRDPEKVARSLKIAREIGDVPARAVEQDPEMGDRLLAAKRVQQAVSDPNIASFFAGNPDGAALAQNDLSAFSSMSALLARDSTRSTYAPTPRAPSVQQRLFGPSVSERLALPSREPVDPAFDPTYNPNEGVLKQSARAVASFPLELARGLGGISTAVLENLNQGTQVNGKGLLDPAIDYLRAADKVTGENSAAIYGGNPSGFLARNLKQGLASAPSSIVVLGMAAMGMPEAGAALLAGQTGGQAYQQGRDAGLSPNRALLFGAEQGIVEDLTERIPVLKYFHDTKVGSSFAKKLVNNFAAELGGEEIATATQDFNEWANLHPDTSIMDYIRARPEAALSTAIAVSVGSAVAVTGTHGLEVGARALGQPARQINDAEADGAYLDQVMQTAEQSTVRKADPETFRQFVEHSTEGSPSKHVYLPVEALDRYAETPGFEKEGQTFFQGYEQQIAEARATGGDVVIPLADVAAHLAGTPAWEAIKDDVRLQPGGLSRREATVQRSELETELDTRGAQVSAEIDAQAKADVPRAAAQEDIKNKLLSIGVGSLEAEQHALLQSHHLATQASLMGMSIEDYRKLHPLEYEDGTTGVKTGRKVKGRTLEQPRFTDDEDYESPTPTLKDVKRIASSIKKFARGAKVTAELAQDSTREVPQLHLTDLYADETGKGGGTKVMQELIRQADEAGLNIVLHPSEPRNKEFYSRFGFENGGGFGRMIRYADIPLPGYLRYEQEARGAATFYPSGKAIISLFATANRSTLLHETSHVWLEELRRNAESENAPDQIKADWETVQRWFEAQGHPLKNGEIPVEAHELFARGGERYFMEGKAPTAELQGAFQRFRAWLLRIYQVVENLRSPITPEIREVFARQIATQEAIDAYAQVNHVEPLFKDAKTAEMTDAEFAAYQASTSDARDAAYDALLYKTMEAIRRRENARMAEQRTNIKEAVAAEANADPANIALELLRTGKWLGDPERKAESIKLNVGALIDTYGEDILDQLPRGRPITAGDGEHPDVVAEMVGMASGSELVKALVANRQTKDMLNAAGDKRSPVQKQIDDETDRRMAERHGDTMTDGTIEEEAIAALNSARQGEIISGEIRQLAKRKTVTGNITPYQIAREWAKRKIAASRVADVASRSALQRYMRQTAKAARLAEKAILDGDVNEAFRQKQAQLLSHAQLAEAKAAADQIDTIVARMKRLAGRAAMASVDQDYMDRVHEILEAYDFRAKSQTAVAEKMSFEKWQEAQAALGYEVLTPPRLEGAQHYSRVQVQDLLDLNDTIENLLHLGKLKEKLITAQGERDYKEWSDSFKETARALPTRKLGDKPINEKKRPIVNGVVQLFKVETLAEKMDDGKTGALNDALIIRATQSANTFDSLFNKVIAPIKAIYESIDKKHWNRLQENVTLPELTWNTLHEDDPRLGQPVTVTRMELLSMFMNMGNLSNMEKMSKGERWPVETLRAVFNRELTKNDYDLAQTLWTQVGTLWPEIVKIERTLSGVVPEKVVNAPFETRFGVYEGGYWPVVYDGARSTRAHENEKKMEDSIFGAMSGVATQKGHTITRTAATGPLTYRLEHVLFRHLNQTITRIAYAEFVRDALRITRDDSITGLIDLKMGPEYTKLITPWLRQQVIGATNIDTARGISNFLKQSRINVTMVGMGFRASTVVAQELGLLASADRIGAKYVGLGMKRSAEGLRGEAKNFVFERSVEMQNRAHSLNREVADFFKEASQPKSRTKVVRKGARKVQETAFVPIALMDLHMVSIPTWLGAHQKGLDEGLTDEAASHYADKEVRMSQGSGRAKDLSQVQASSNEAVRMLTMFYTPFNVMFQAQWKAYDQVKRGNFKPAASFAFYWVMLTALGSALLSGDGPKDDDGESDWMAWFLRNVGMGLFSSVPVGRELANYAGRKSAGQYATLGQYPVTRVLTAMSDAGSIILDGGKAGYTALTGHEFETAPEAPGIRKTGDTLGLLLGLPTGQIGATAKFAYDTHTGEQNPQTLKDYYFGITKGKVPEPAQEDR